MGEPAAQGLLCCRLSRGAGGSSARTLRVPPKGSRGPGAQEGVQLLLGEMYWDIKKGRDARGLKPERAVTEPAAGGATSLKVA